MEEYTIYKIPRKTRNSKKESKKDKYENFHIDKELNKIAESTHRKEK